MSSVPNRFEFGLETPVKKPVVRARLKRLPIEDVAVFRASCGREHQCPGNLGTVHHQHDLEFLPWIIEHKRGYRGYADTGYYIFPEKPTRHSRTGRHIGRRPSTNPEVPTGNMRPVIGEIPMLPATIHCPICGTPNEVLVPDS